MNSCLNIFLNLSLAQILWIKIYINIYRTIWVPKQIQTLILDLKPSSILANIHWKPTTPYAWTRKSYILTLVGIVFDMRLQMEDSIWMPHHFLVNLCRTQSTLHSKSLNLFTLMTIKMRYRYLHCIVYCEYLMTFPYINSKITITITYPVHFPIIMVK